MAPTEGNISSATITHGSPNEEESLQWHQGPRKPLHTPAKAQSKRSSNPPSRLYSLYPSTTTINPLPANASALQLHQLNCARAYTIAHPNISRKSSVFLIDEANLPFPPLHRPMTPTEHEEKKRKSVKERVKRALVWVGDCWTGKGEGWMGWAGGIRGAVGSGVGRGWGVGDIQGVWLRCSYCEGWRCTMRHLCSRL